MEPVPFNVTKKILHGFLKANIFSYLSGLNWSTIELDQLLKWQRSKFESQFNFNTYFLKIKIIQGK